MPWKEQGLMSLRKEFVHLSKNDGVSFTELCRRFGISRKTGYKWCHRYQQEGVTALQDQSRRPKESPKRTPQVIEDVVVSKRQEQPTWGGRKIHHRLLALGYKGVPSSSTITDILRRYGLLHQAGEPQRPFIRFERSQPNELWQMDFKGYFKLGSGHRCDPLTLLDDHSRYNLCLKACSSQKRQTVQAALTDIFRRYGLPDAMTMDNGGPWGAHAQEGGKYTQLRVWLLKLGVRVSYSRPYHPQTQGKLERFHRSLKADVLQLRDFRDQEECQSHFDIYRSVYNNERPHEALDYEVPSKRYHASERSFPEVLRSPEYDENDVVLKVRTLGSVTYKQKQYFVGKAFKGEYIAVKQWKEDELDFYYGSHKIKNWNVKV